MENNIQINKNTLLIVSILIVIGFVSSITAAYLIGVRYGEETILPMQVVTPTPIQAEPALPDQQFPIEQGETMPGEQGQRTPMSEDLEVACTMEAKICPDGSSVGRMPPNCEFAPCPGE